MFFLKGPSIKIDIFSYEIRQHSLYSLVHESQQRLLAMSKGKKMKCVIDRQRPIRRNNNWLRTNTQRSWTVFHASWYLKKRHKSDFFPYQTFFTDFADFFLQKYSQFGKKKSTLFFFSWGTFWVCQRNHGPKNITGGGTTKVTWVTIVSL